MENYCQCSEDERDIYENSTMHDVFEFCRTCRKEFDKSKVVEVKKETEYSNGYSQSKAYGGL